jgi:hypothetical protein
LNGYTIEKVAIIPDAAPKIELTLYTDTGKLELTITYGVIKLKRIDWA